MRARVTFLLPVDYDDEVTDPDTLGDTLDRIFETALGTPWVMDECGDPHVGRLELPPQTTACLALEVNCRDASVRAEILDALDGVLSGYTDGRARWGFRLTDSFGGHLYGEDVAPDEAVQT